MAKGEVERFVEKMEEGGLKDYIQMRYLSPYRPIEGVDKDIERSDANRSRMEGKRTNRQNATWSWIKDSYSHGPLGME